MADERKNRPIADVAVATEKGGDANQPDALHLSDEMRRELAKYKKLEELVRVVQSKGKVTIEGIQLIQAWLSLHQAERVRPHHEKTWGREAALVEQYLQKPDGGLLTTITGEGGLRKVLQDYNTSLQTVKSDAVGEIAAKSQAEAQHPLVLLFYENYQTINSMPLLIGTVKLIPADEKVRGIAAGKLVRMLEYLQNRWSTLRIMQQASFQRGEQVFPRAELFKTVKNMTEIQDLRLVEKILSLLEPEPKPKK